MAKWIDSTGDERVGDLLFLREVTDTSNGATHWRASDRPARTNQSHEPRLYGWCGETDNRSVMARGLWRVARVATNGRTQLVKVPDAELAAALESVGFPELAPA